MELADVVRVRRMVRAYHPARPVPDAVLDRLLPESEVVITAIGD